MNHILVRHDDRHHVLPRDDRLPAQADLHLLDMPMRIGLFPHREDLILVIHQGELRARRALCRALDLCSQKAVVALIKELGSAATLRRKYHRGGFPCEGGEEGVVGVVVVED
jgi:hypothetical protein